MNSNRKKQFYFDMKKASSMVLKKKEDSFVFVKIEELKAGTPESQTFAREHVLRKVLSYRRHGQLKRGEGFLKMFLDKKQKRASTFFSLCATNST